MSKRRRPQTHRTKSERALEEIYAEIPSIPDCTGACAVACGPIAMFKGEWDRVTRSFGRVPRQPVTQLNCPMLSPTGKCMVYTVRPYICRLWGTTRSLRCPEGCEPERWLSTEEAQDIHERIAVVAGPEVTGPLGGMDAMQDALALWQGFALEAREARANLMEKIDDAKELIRDARSTP